jgi:hypothetical protein
LNVAQDVLVEVGDRPTIDLHLAPLAPYQVEPLKLSELAKILVETRAISTLVQWSF